MIAFHGPSSLLKGGIAPLGSNDETVRQILLLQYQPDMLTLSCKIAEMGTVSGEQAETEPPRSQRSRMETVKAANKSYQ